MSIGIDPAANERTALYSGMVNALRKLDPEPDLIVLIKHFGDDRQTIPLWSNDSVTTRSQGKVIKTVTTLLEEGGELGAIVENVPRGHSVWAEPLCLDDGVVRGALVVVRAGGEHLSDGDLTAVSVFAAVCASSWADEVIEAYRSSLDNLVVEVANQLMPASGLEAQEVLDWTCETLATFLGADVCFIRYNDHKARTSNLVAEYPKREDVPEVDPLGIVPFDSDPMFGMTEDLKEPVVGAQSSSPDSYRERIAEARTDLPWSGAVTPLLDGDVTTGILAFIYMEERAWVQSEINALQAVASLLSQLRGRMAAETQLRHNAEHDELTGLHNRRSLLAEIDRRLKADGDHLAVLFMDLDRFKIMNDYLGHAAGDQILVVCADRIRTSLRPGDFAARLGGDEFVILLERESDAFGAMAAANRMLELVARPIEVEAKMISHSGSIGIAIADDTVVTSQQLMANADVALYAAKRLGGNQAVIFDPTLSAESDERSNLELTLRDAIGGGDLLLHYQPEFDLTTGEVLAVEALIRWRHPERGLIAAGEFILVAEETGLIVDLGRWILEEACHALVRLERRHPSLDIIMRINVSPAELAVPGSLDYIQQTIVRTGVRPEQICLEITEHAFFGDTDRAVSTLKALRAMGLSLAIDDFGTGFSSLTQLKELPFNVMKIDGSFIRDVSENRVNQVIVEASVNLARAFGLDVVAEGIEYPETIPYLLGIGCFRAQGYLLARPMPMDALDEILAGRPIDVEALRSTDA